MDEGGKQLGAIVIAVVVVVLLIAIARLVFASDGAVKDKIDDELDKITSGTSYVEPIELDEVQSVIEVIC